jgi:uncharacterized protein (DUF433 family)
MSLPPDQMNTIGRRRCVGNIFSSWYNLGTSVPSDVRSRRATAPSSKEIGPMPAKAKTKRKTKSGSRQPTLVGNHLVVDPRVCHGELTFRGTRVPVATILSYLAKGYSQAYLRKSWPEVSSEAIAEAVSLASEQLVEHYRDGKS